MYHYEKYRDAALFFFAGACIVLGVLVLVLAAGCKAESGQRRPFTQPTVLYTSPAGTLVTFPSWVPAEMRAEALAEIDAAGLPPGWQVVIRLPKYEEPESPTGLARGTTSHALKTVFVGWRFHPYEDRPLMPALTYEVEQNVYGPGEYMDPNTGTTTGIPIPRGGPPR